MKDKFAGLAPIAGGIGGAVTVKVTGIETEVAPVAASIIVAVYVPVASVPKVVVTVAEPLPVPDAGESVNHAALSLADQVSVPPPVLLIVRLWAVGLAPPCCAVNDRLTGLVPIAGGIGAAVTVRATGTVTVVAPEAVTVTRPL